MAEQKIILCPYCGHYQKTSPERCESCGGRFDMLSRRATQISMGSWFVRDPKRPFLPGCTYEVLKLRLAAGKIKPLTIIRGPTTRQFWSVARNVPGVANLLGYCHKCGAAVDATDKKCGVCSASFALSDMRVPDSDELGLLFPTREIAIAAQKALDVEIEKVLGNPAGPVVKPGELPIGASQLTTSSGDTGAGLPAITGDESPGLPGSDLLDDILGDAAPARPAPTPPLPDLFTPPPSLVPPPAPPVKAVAPVQSRPPTNADFADDVQDVEQPAIRPRKKDGISAVTVLLIFVIVLMAIGMVVLVLKVLSPPAPASPATPAAGSSGYSAGTAEAPANPARPTAAPVAPAAPAASIFATTPPASAPPFGAADPTAPKPAAPVADAAPAPTADSTPAPTASTPTPAPAPTSTPAAAPPTTAPIAAVPGPAKPTTKPAPLPPPLPMPQAIIEAQKLEDAGKPAQALAILRRSASITPLSQRPLDFDDIYRRLEGKASAAAVKPYMEPPPDMRK